MVKMTGFMGFSYCIVYAMNTALRIVDFILDLLFGYTIRHGSLNERIRSESYECSAQLVDIVAWGAHSYVLIQPHNYVWKHKRYVHPRYVLEHDNITLMGITPTHAFFCVSDSKVDVRNIKEEPFLIIAQCNAAKQLIVMPHSSFNQLAAEIGAAPSDRKLTFVNMTARCGSTLLGQIIAQTPNTRVLSEPWALVHVNCLLNCHRISEAEFKTLLRNVVHILCNWEHNKQIKHVFIKATTFMAPAFPMLKEMFPGAKFIFNTRNFQPSFESYMQTLLAQPAFVNLTGELSQWVLENLPIPHDDVFFNDLHREWKLRGKKLDFNDGVARIALGYGAQISEFLRHRDDYHLIVLYEDIQTDPKYICRKLLDVCEVPPEHIPDAMEALKHDSQKGIFGRRGDKPRIESDVLRAADNLFEECGIPISSRTSAEDFKDFISTGTYTVRSQYDPPSEIYDRVFAGVRHVSRLESFRIMMK